MWHPAERQWTGSHCVATCMAFLCKHAFMSTCVCSPFVHLIVHVCGGGRVWGGVFVCVCVHTHACVQLVCVQRTWRLAPHCVLVVSVATMKMFKLMPSPGGCSKNARFSEVQGNFRHFWRLPTIL